MSEDRPPRSHIGLQVKLEACLLALGFTESQFADVQWDHDPPLGLRGVNADGTDYIPPQNDPKHIVPRLRTDHKVKTTGRSGESKLSVSGNGDVSRIAKAKRLAEAQETVRKILAGEKWREKPERPKSKWPQGRKIPSRPFAKARG
jgi:hypothetical protein